MKRMRKNIIFIGWAGALLLSACDRQEDFNERESGTAPAIKAVVEEMPKTKAGVIEENEDYAAGEKFYWSNGDATTVFFRHSGMSDASQYKKADYAANVADGVRSNSCTFDVVQAESIDNGEYTAYGLYPTAAWDVRTGYSSFLQADIPAYQTQTEANSSHLGAYMLMKAQNEVTVNGGDPVNLTYRHLASVIRFAVWNNSGNNNLKLANINTKLASGKAVFATQGQLADIDAVSLTKRSYLNASELTLSLTGNARNFRAQAGKNQCEGYMALLPTATDAFESSDDLTIELSFTDGTNNYLVSKSYNIGTTLDFLANGIEQGKNYYFRLKVEDGDLSPITGTSYAIGDYWPNSVAPEGIVFWVKPGSLGTQGKVVGLGETYVAKWGPDNDEQADGVTGIRSTTDGATATRNMIAKYKGNGTFAADYPAFYHIYNTVNGGEENGVWYLPARDELKMLFAGYSGKDYESITNWITQEMPGYDSADCMASRATFDAKLTAKGGIAIGGSGNSVNWWYLSATERSATGSYSVTLEKGHYSSDLKNFDGNIRWIRDF